MSPETCIIMEENEKKEILFCDENFLKKSKIFIGQLNVIELRFILIDNFKIIKFQLVYYIYV